MTIHVDDCFIMLDSCPPSILWLVYRASDPMSEGSLSRGAENSAAVIQLDGQFRGDKEKCAETFFDKGVHLGYQLYILLHIERHTDCTSYLPGSVGAPEQDDPDEFIMKIYCWKL